MKKINFKLLISSLYLKGDFKKYPAGENCPLNRIVVTPRVCKEASAALGLAYCGAVKDSYFPAGCYHDNSKSYFNEYVDPSITSPAFFGNKGGICYKGKFWYCHRKENICINIYILVR